MTRSHSLSAAGALVAVAALTLFASRAEAALACAAGNGDVVANPIINNTGPQTISQGSKVFYAVAWPGKPKITNSFVLANALPPGGAVSAPNYYAVFYSCTAWTSSGVVKKPNPALIQIVPRCIPGVTC